MLQRLFNTPYKIINIIFAGIGIVIISYSGFYSAKLDNHPIECSVYISTGKICPTCGVSRAFSEIVRLNFDSAIEYNPLSIKIFLFFFIQTIIRIIFLGLLIFKFKQNLILYTDIILSTSLFLYSFNELISYV